MNKVEELKKSIAEDLGRRYESRGIENFFLIAYKKVEELIQAVRDEELDKLEASCDICSFFCGNCPLCPLRNTRHCPNE